MWLYTFKPAILVTSVLDLGETAVWYCLHLRLCGACFYGRKIHVHSRNLVVAIYKHCPDVGCFLQLEQGCMLTYIVGTGLSSNCMVKVSTSKIPPSNQIIL